MVRRVRYCFTLLRSRAISLLSLRTTTLQHPAGSIAKCKEAFQGPWDRKLLISAGIIREKKKIIRKRKGQCRSVCIRYSLCFCNYLQMKWTGKWWPRQLFISLLSPILRKFIGKSQVTWLLPQKEKMVAQTIDSWGNGTWDIQSPEQGEEGKHCSEVPIIFMLTGMQGASKIQD